MKRQSKLTSRQSEQEQQLSQHQAQEQSTLEFPTIEAMLRHDALKTPVPPNIKHRLQESIGPAPTRSWWRRFFGS